MSSPLRAPAALMVLACCGLACGCGHARTLSDDERELTVWFIEDIAHGHPRRPAELAVTAPSATMRRFADWLSGGTSGRYQQGGESAPAEYHPPGALAARLERWPSLRTLFAAHQVVALANGLVAARPDLTTEDALVALPVVDHENLDRRAIDALAVGMEKDGGGGDHRAWLALAAAARRELDLQAGAEAWPPPAAAAHPEHGTR